MIGQVLQFSFPLKLVCNCVTCGVSIVMPESSDTELRRSHESFYCFNGHKQFWPQKSDVALAQEATEREKQARLRAEAREASLRESRTHLEHRLNGTKGALVKVQKRIRNGVCPSCNRQFTDLQKHMACKHPDFAKPE